MRKTWMRGALAATLLVTAGTFALAADKPIYGKWGLDTAGMDTGVKAGDNFFRYANGAWLDSHPIPADKPAVSLRLEMTDRTEGRLHDILEAAAAAAPHQPADLEGKAGAFYKAFMDEAHVEQLGSKPIQPELNAVRRAKNREALALLMGRNNSDFEASLYSFGIDVDLKDPNHYAIYLSQSGLGLPDRDYYLQPNFAPAKAKYQAYVAQLLHLLNWKNADLRAKEVVAFETKIANFTPTNSFGTAGEPQKSAEYFGVSEEKLNKLPTEKLLELRENGALGQIYAHLLSLVGWDRLVALAMARQAQAPAAANS